jgi:hypothetical protein
MIRNQTLADPQCTKILKEFRRRQGTGDQCQLWVGMGFSRANRDAFHFDEVMRLQRAAGLDQMVSVQIMFHDWIYLIVRCSPPIRLRLRIDQRVSIDFGSTREAEYLMCSERAHLGRLNRRVRPAKPCEKMR